VVERGPHDVADRPSAAAVREEDRVEERHVGDVRREDDVQERVVGELAVGAEPDLGVRFAGLAELAVRRFVDVTQVDRLARLQELLDDLGGEVVVAAEPLRGGGQRDRVGGGRHGGWCSKPSSCFWKDADRAKIGCPCCTATVRRALKERPSFMRSTV